MTEEVRARSVYLAQGVWKSTRGEWTETQEIEVVMAAGLDPSGNNYTKGQG